VGVGPSFWTPVDDLGRGLDFEGRPEGGEQGGLDADALSEGQGRVTAAGKAAQNPRRHGRWIRLQGPPFGGPLRPARGGGREAAYGRGIFWAEAAAA
jgi:hypothetical protein